MAALQNFRSALNGFNREDVVHYIEYINNKHTTEVNQLNTEIQALQVEISQMRRCSREDLSVSVQLEESKTRILELEQELAQVRAQLDEAAARPQTNEELEAYRRAERAERVAQERVTQLYTQANGVLADATARTDETVSQISGLADLVCAQLSQLQTAIASGANTIRDTAASMYAIKPITEEE